MSLENGIWPGRAVRDPKADYPANKPRGLNGVDLRRSAHVNPISPEFRKRLRARKSILRTPRLVMVT